MPLDLTEPIRAAIVGSPIITTLLPAYQGSFPVFTRRPVPTTAPYPSIVISQDISNTNEDGVNDFRSIVLRDIAVYGRNSIPGEYRLVDNIAYKLRTLFHRQRLALVVTDWCVIDIVINGPSEAPEEDQIVGRLLQMTTRLGASA